METKTGTQLVYRKTKTGTQLVYRKTKTGTQLVYRKNGDGGHRRLVHENQPFGLDPVHLPAERAAFLLDVGSALLIGVQRLLLAGQSQAKQGPPYGGRQKRGRS